MKKIKKFEDFEWVDAITELEDDNDLPMDTEVEDELSQMIYDLMDKYKLGKSKVLNILNNLKNKL